MDPVLVRVVDYRVLGLIVKLDDLSLLEDVLDDGKKGGGQREEGIRVK